jgi:maltooligosyltrehalose trehalohydrolase
VTLAPPERLRAGLAILLLSPQIPMLFMGEEYAASQPFLYFCNYQGELAKAIREGRRNEFASFRAFADEQQREKIPDPNAYETYVASQLDPDDRNQSPHREWLAYTRELLRLRAEKIVPLIPGIIADAGKYETDERMLTVTWRVTSGTLVMQANLGGTPRQAPSPGEVWYSTAGGMPRGRQLEAWEVRVSWREL